MSDFTHIKLQYLMILFLIIFFLAYEYSKYRVEVQKEIKVGNFIKKGGRNTAANGIDLCLRVNELEKHHLIKSKNCCLLYNKEDSCKKDQ